jgi:hypothetical protein
VLPRSPAPAASVHGLPVLLLCWGEQVADVLHRGEAGTAALRLLASDILEPVVHVREIRLVRTHLLTDVKARHREIGPVSDGLLGRVEQQGPDLPLLLVAVHPIDGAIWQADVVEDVVQLF